MKTFIAILITIGASILGSVSAQQPIAKKPPVGIPADATSFNGKWYRVYFEKGSWQHARDRCNVLGGQLAIVPDEATHAFIKKLADSTALWLGATDEKVKNVWVWSDGSRMTFKAWDTEHGQPNGGRKENYLLIWKTGKWHDAGEQGDQQTVGFICEWKAK